MSDIAIRVENLGKLYRLGEVGTGTISHDLNRWIAKIRGKEDPFAKVGESNDRTQKGSSNYVWALQNVDFEVKKGEVLGIVGRNGAGKSTLLKLLSKVTQPSSGNIKVNGRIASLLEVGTGFHPEMTGRENIFLNGAIMGMTKREIKAKFDEIVDFAGVERYVDTPVKRYSSGMYVRLAFAVAAHLEPEILIVDEVLAVGDAEFQKKCLGKMKDVSVNDGRTVLFVSHNMGAVRDLCNKCLYLKHGMVEMTGDTDPVIQDYLKSATSNEIVSDKELRKLTINQVGDKIILDAEYEMEHAIDIPHLGFLVSNAFGVPVFASNPTIDLVPFSSQNNYKKGKIHVVVSNPKLTDGNYTVSVWFGDSKQNIITLPDCITFEVTGMTGQKQLYNTALGNVLPECKWTFS